MLQLLEEGLDDFSITAENDILLKMQEFCVSYKLEPDDLVTNWIAFATTKGIDKDPTLEVLTQFEKEKLMKMNKGKQRKKTSAPVIYDSASIDHLSDRIHPGQVTPENRRKNQRINSPSTSLLHSPSSFSPLNATPSAKYSTRKASGDVVCTFGNTENVVWKASKPTLYPISPYHKGSALKETYKCMFEKLRDYAYVLNDVIENAAMKYKKIYDIEEWSPIHLPIFEPAPVIGHVYSEDGGKLNAKTLILEGCETISSGQTVSLDVSELPSYSLFSGQVIAGKGINNYGKCLMLKELYEPVTLPFPEQKELPEDELIIVMAAGPFTTSDSISYEPLRDLLKYLKSNKPHLLLLFGPFFDIKHAEIRSGKLPESYEDMFQELVMMIMQDLEDVMVVLIPSPRDIHHVPVYPIPPFRLKMNYKNLYRASDPCILNVNGIVIGLTATDILFHLGKEEIHSGQISDRLGRLCKHLLNQANFYPLYPPSEDINMDHGRYEMHCNIPVMPHILVIPSDLRHFVKNINGCCCINPERLTKGCVGGTFARIKINQIDPTEYTGSIIENISAEIVKI